jgi:hypothetical protein
MKRRHKMCETCPFRNADEAYRKESAAMDIPLEWWPCHTESGPNNDPTDVVCRGFWEACKSYPQPEYVI